MPVLRIFLVCILLIVGLQTFTWAGDVRYLYVIGAMDRDFGYNTLYKLKFEDGIYKGSDSTLTACDEITGTNRLNSQSINDRYIMFSNLCIYDTKHDSIVYSEPDEYRLLGISNDTVFLARSWRRMNPDQTEPEVYYLDLQGEIKPVPLIDKTSKWYVQCRNWSLLRDLHFSSDEKYFVSAYEFQICKAITIHDIIKDTSKVLADSLGASVSCCSPFFRPVIPTYWLDNENIISQRSNGDLVIINLNGNITDFVKIEDMSELFYEPYFMENSNGQIFYCCKDKYLLDFNNKTYTKYNWDEEGYGFETDYEGWPSANDTNYIRYENEIISKYFGSREAISAGDKYIAIDLRARSYLIQENGDKRYPRGIFIWNAYTREWSEVKFERIDEIVGWVPAE